MLVTISVPQTSTIRRFCKIMYFGAGCSLNLNMTLSRGVILQFKYLAARKINTFSDHYPSSAIPTPLAWLVFIAENIWEQSWALLRPCRPIQQYPVPF